MNRAGSLPEMVNSSVVVFTRPRVSTFEAFERQGNLQSSLIYVGIAALIAGVLGLVGGGVLGLLGGVVSALVSFIVFTFLVFYIGQSQGGTGSLDEVAYTFSLFWAPLTVISAVLSLIGRVIPLLGCLVGVPLALVILVAEVYLGYLAVQSSMNLTDRTKAIITLVGAAVVMFIVSMILSAVFSVGALIV